MSIRLFHMDYKAPHWCHPIKFENLLSDFFKDLVGMHCQYKIFYIVIQLLYIIEPFKIFEFNQNYLLIVIV